MWASLPCTSAMAQVTVRFPRLAHWWFTSNNPLSHFFILLLINEPVISFFVFIHNPYAGTCVPRFVQARRHPVSVPSMPGSCSAHDTRHNWNSDENASISRCWCWKRSVAMRSCNSHILQGAATSCSLRAAPLDDNDSVIESTAIVVTCLNAAKNLKLCHPTIRCHSNTACSCRNRRNFHISTGLDSQINCERCFRNRDVILIFRLRKV